MAKKASKKPSTKPVGTSKKTAKGGNILALDSKYEDLYRWNIGLAGFCLLQALVILLLAKDRVFPLHLSYPTPDPIATNITGQSVFTLASRHLFDVHLMYLVAYFLLVPVVVHGVAATMYRFQYQADLKKQRNILRWISFGLSSSLMVVAVALVSGVSELPTLALLGVLGLIGAMAGLVSELLRADGNFPALRWMQVVGYGALGAAILVLIAQGVGVVVYGSGSLSGYVYAIYGSLLVVAGLGIAHHVGAIRQTGRWANYIRVEQGYMLLQAVAVTAVTWLLFSGALRP